MKRAVRSLGILAVTVFLLFPLSAYAICPVHGTHCPSVQQSVHKPSYRSDRIIIKLKAGESPQDMKLLHSANGVKVQKTLKHLPRHQVLELPKGADPVRFVEKYQKSGRVEYAELDHVGQPAIAPNDYYYAGSPWQYQWGMHNRGDNGGIEGADIDAERAWDIRTSASSIIIAILDTGIRHTHQDLVPNMWTNPGEWGHNGELATNGLDDDGNGYVDDAHGINMATNTGDITDSYGHGTYVAGAAAAKGDNYHCIAGVAWDAKLMGLKTDFSSSSIAEGIDYAITYGVSIINCSFSAGEGSTVYEAIQEARAANILVVCAAGNDNRDNDEWGTYPGSFDLDNIVAVGASDNRDELAMFG